MYTFNNIYKHSRILLKIYDLSKKTIDIFHLKYGEKITYSNDIEEDVIELYCIFLQINEIYKNIDNLLKSTKTNDEKTKLFYLNMINMESKLCYIKRRYNLVNEINKNIIEKIDLLI